MFYDNYLRLCNRRGISASAAALEMGLSRAAVTGWAQGNTPRDSTLRRIADYFGVTVDELREVLRQNGVRILLDADAKDFTPEEIREIANFIKFKRGQRDS